MPISTARTIAFDALLRVENEAAYASELLHARLNENTTAKVSARDAALATEIVISADAVFRRRAAMCKSGHQLRWRRIELWRRSTKP